MSNKNDALIFTLKSKIEKKRELLKDKKGTYSSLTNCVLNHKTLQYNLNTLDENGLGLLLLDLTLYKSAYEKVKDSLNFTLKLSGYEIDDWIKDIYGKLSVISYRNEKQKLNKLQDQLDLLLSEDAKTDLKLREIENLLGD